MKEGATFGVWYAHNGTAFAFVRWLKESEADQYLSLDNAAQVFLDAGGPRGAELRPGRYMIQRLNRGASGEAIQCLIFDAVPMPTPLRAVVPV